jgi:hypothetical protein
MQMQNIDLFLKACRNLFKVGTVAMLMTVPWHIALMFTFVAAARARAVRNGGPV